MSSLVDVEKVLRGLKDFQRSTVDYVFERMYLDEDFASRFLVADEVGLGKTLVARGLIAKAVDYLQTRTDRIDVIYVCSNSDIARQNIARLQLDPEHSFALASRITLLPINMKEIRESRLNFISFTPGTSLELPNSTGISIERQLLFWLIPDEWRPSHKKSARVLEGFVDTERFRWQLDQFDREQIHPQILDSFQKELAKNDSLSEEFLRLTEELPRAGFAVPPELNQRRNRMIGSLRKILARTCIQWLEPDLIILDEFQRFKDLLHGDSEAAQLAHALFDHRQNEADPRTSARLLMLSATPYKMYTQSHETSQDDHYADFKGTLEFLLKEPEQRTRFQNVLQEYREAILALPANDGRLEAAKVQLERTLRRVMVRTERLATSVDRNGMLLEIKQPLELQAGDVQQYLTVQKVARLLEHDDVMEFWKSAPYLLNFMDEYLLKAKLKVQLEKRKPDAEFESALQAALPTLLNRQDLSRYRDIDPGNARLRALSKDVIESGAWQLLWIPPAMPYYTGTGAYADEKLSRFTKRLVFSSWRVVPKSISAFLSYEAERKMLHCLDKQARNTKAARKKRRALLRFSVAEGRPTGMPVLGMIYPCRTLAERFDPWKMTASRIERGEHVSAQSLLSEVEAQLQELLAPWLTQAPTDGPIDESWYWMTPLLLDRQFDAAAAEDWLGREECGDTWAGSNADGDDSTSKGWLRHVKLARKSIADRNRIAKLGQPPKDLARIMALLAVAGPGVCAWRCLDRVTREQKTNPDEQLELRDFAGPTAYAFLHLFNLPEVSSMLRAEQQDVPYWKAVLEHCLSGNLQAALDEYVHFLVEAEGLVGASENDVACGISGRIQDVLTLPASRVQVDLLRSDGQRTAISAHRFRTRFAVRFGDHKDEQTGEQTRADSVRDAFNSPFWPFVLATTSVGQEGLDFHPYCHAIVHWNLPSNPVDLEQREGRIHRYKGHAVRRNVAEMFGKEAGSHAHDPWEGMFGAAKQARQPDQNDLHPFWLAATGTAKIERHVPSLPHSREVVHHANLQRSLALYRMVFGQSRQDDLVRYLERRLTSAEIDEAAKLCRIELGPLSAQQ